MTLTFSNCRGCQLPDRLRDKHFCTIWTPQSHTLHKVATSLNTVGIKILPSPSGLVARTEISNHHVFFDTLLGALTDVEQRDTKVLFNNAPEPSLEDFSNIQSVDQAVDAFRGEFVISLLNDDRLDVHAQPIVDADAIGQTVHGFEFLMRGRDTQGNQIPPSDLLHAARDPRVLFNLDRDARIKAVESAARSGLKEKLFINFLPGAVYDPNVCLRTTEQAVHKYKINPNNVVFEIVESERIDDIKHLRGIVNYYRSAGFLIALDDYGSGMNNLETYLALRPDYIKLDKTVTDGVVTDASTRNLVSGMVKSFHESGIKIIAEGIETEDMARSLRDMGADLLQGYYFGRPAPLSQHLVAA